MHSSHRPSTGAWRLARARYHRPCGVRGGVRRCEQGGQHADELVSPTHGAPCTPRTRVGTPPASCHSRRASVCSPPPPPPAPRSAADGCGANVPRWPLPPPLRSGYPLLLRPLPRPLRWRARREEVVSAQRCGAAHTAPGYGQAVTLGHPTRCAPSYGRESAWGWKRRPQGPSNQALVRCGRVRPFAPRVTAASAEQISHPCSVSVACSSCALLQ
jgi:hypothetical protein